MAPKNCEQGRTHRGKHGCLWPLFLFLWTSLVPCCCVWRIRDSRNCNDQQKESSGPTTLHAKWLDSRLRDPSKTSDPSKCVYQLVTSLFLLCFAQGVEHKQALHCRVGSAVVSPSFSLSFRAGHHPRGTHHRSLRKRRPQRLFFGFRISPNHHASGPRGHSEPMRACMDHYMSGEPEAETCSRRTAPAAPWSW